MQVREAAKVRNRQTTWYVQSEFDALVEYIVHNKRNPVSHHKVWTCNCPDFTERRQFNGTNCKHITEVLSYVRLKEAAKAVTAAPATKTAKEVIALVVAMLNGPKEHAKPLWDILTALRGPDNDDSNLKEITTATIRGAIGLCSYSHTGAIVRKDKPFGADLNLGTGSLGTNDYYKLVEDLKQHNSQGHFAQHYRSALQALKQLGYIK